MTAQVAPQVSVVIPTYNRSTFLRETLESLADQRFEREDFEVIVSDDGSSDDTAQVVESFRDRLRIEYCFQEDEGFRAASARNNGARLASAPVLAFLDTGTLAGPDFVRSHLEAHSRGSEGRAVIGYTFGYRPWGTLPGLAESLAQSRPEEVVEQYREDRQFWDWRHEVLAEVDFDPNRRAVPWMLFWTVNCSLRADDFWSVGGFDEDFRTWGAEDMELAFRLHKSGRGFAVTRDGWAIEAPHERDMNANVQSNKINARMFLRKHPEPVSELAWWVFLDECLWSLEHEYAALLRWTEQAQTIDVRAELEREVENLDVPVERVAVLGCGDSIPPGLAGATLIDFDAEVIDRLRADGHQPVHHALGIRTPLREQSVESVIVTSRLKGLWERWSDDILDEALRIGSQVSGPLAANYGERWRRGADATSRIG